MPILLLQTFLLLLAAYFAGAFTACLAKRWIGAGEEEPEYVPAPFTQPALPPPGYVAHGAVLSPAAAAAAAAARAAQLGPQGAPALRPAYAPRVEIKPRAIELVQPKIDLLPRPPPRPTPSVADTSRFERALMGPDPNEGMPRRPIVEIRPAVFEFVTGPPEPWPPPKRLAPPEPEPEAAAAAPRPSKYFGFKLRKEKSAAVDAPIEAPSSADESKPRAGISSAAANAAAAASAALAAARSAATSVSLRPAKAARAEPEDGGRQPLPDEPADRARRPMPAVMIRPADDFETDDEPPAAPTVDVVAGDDLQRIRAIDAATEEALVRQGVTRFETIAHWSASDIDRLDGVLELSGRIDREQWVEQAQILAKGGETYYSRNRVRAAAAAGKAGPAQAGDRKPASQKDPRSVAEIAAAAAAAIAAASASVTRGNRPIEPISPLSKADPSVVMPTKLSVAIKEKVSKEASEDDSADSVLRDMPFGESEGSVGDDLKRIRGVGVLIEKRLKTLGVTTYRDIANWTNEDIDRISQTLDFKGRIERENWVEQARILSSGGPTEYSGRVDRGEI